ncbi:TPA: hypothetical protein ACX6R9_003274, partial [Photobacterium damselae]
CGGFFFIDTHSPLFFCPLLSSVYSFLCIFLAITVFFKQTFASYLHSKSPILNKEEIIMQTTPTNK